MDGRDIDMARIESSYVKHEAGTPTSGLFTVTRTNLDAENVAQIYTRRVKQPDGTYKLVPFIKRVKRLEGDSARVNGLMYQTDIWLGVLIEDAGTQGWKYLFGKPNNFHKEREQGAPLVIKCPEGNINQDERTKLLAAFNKVVENDYIETNFPEEHARYIMLRNWLRSNQKANYVDYYRMQAKSVGTFEVVMTADLYSALAKARSRMTFLGMSFSSYLDFFRQLPNIWQQLGLEEQEMIDICTAYGIDHTDPYGPFVNIMNPDRLDLVAGLVGRFRKCACLRYMVEQNAVFNDLLGND
jgi:hypothetical protein